MINLEELKSRLGRLAGPEPSEKQWEDGSWRAKTVDRSVLVDAASAIESLQRELEEARHKLKMLGHYHIAQDMFRPLA